ncbi:uncharacterized protein LOC135484296 isoform X2 [Lineus longissimus]|uniref:uncharacterized protein LOC135484296 isoform X2 n=1 Tax=Lineus longissimus TaxID=88925 RepID=UPI002B4DB5B6
MASNTAVGGEPDQELAEEEELQDTRSCRTEPSGLAPDGGWGWVVVFGSFVVYFIADGCVYSFGVFYDELLDYFGEILTEPCYRNQKDAEPGDDDNQRQLRPTSSMDYAIKENIPMVQLHKPEEGEGIDSLGEMMVISESKIVLLSREGSQCEKMSTMSEPSVTASMIVSKGSSNQTFESETESSLGSSSKFKKDESLVLTTPHLRPVGQVVSKSAELLNIPGKAMARKMSSSDQGLLGRKESIGRCTSLQEIHYHRGGSPIIFTSHASLRRPTSESVGTASIQEDATILRRHTVTCDSSFLLELRQAFIDMFDVTLIRQPGFLLICVSNFMLCLWFGAPYIYIVNKASLHGIEQLQASFLVSIIGITSTVGQVVLGFLGDKLKNCVFIYEVSMVLCGIATLLIPACQSYWSHCLTVAVFGFFISANYSLTTLILIQAVGLQKLTTAFGFLQLGQGIGTVLGTPLVGLVYDRTDSYSMAFYIAGAWICMSGIILLPLHWLIKDKESCLHANPEEEEDCAEFEEVTVPLQI